ncbi:MAG: hypothetical protein H6618_02560 [Deltaproteobacteria bacterium]|nr:hypothetical protein [Deltaproteobacteria bacterium]
MIPEQQHDQIRSQKRQRHRAPSVFILFMSVFLMIYHVSCSPKGSEKGTITEKKLPPSSISTSKDTGKNSETESGKDKENAKLENSDPDVTTSKNPIIRPKVSAFAIDDNQFQIIQFTVGLQDFMSSETPVLSYKIPEAADYVEILRCHSETNGLNAILDLELSNQSETQKSQEYRSKDYFVVSEADHSCELISAGHAQPDFADSFAPSGSYRYLIRACLSPDRLLHKEALSSRNCSRRVSISSELKNFINKRKEKEKSALRLATLYGTKIDNTTNAMRQRAESAIVVLEECEERNRQRLITQKIRDAWLTIISATIEVGFEFKSLEAGTAGAIARHYTFRGPSKFQSFVDLMQLGGALQGFILADTFKKLSATSQDMVRTCATYKRLLDEYTILENSLGDYAYKYHYYYGLADQARQGQLIADGEDIQLPAVESARSFEDPPLPESETEEETETQESNGS